ncbi:uncharacterized protein PHACADRAFT_261598 [Phanerochaete carnosa HHB-10118-sp]|uniref:Uncharacterized protein n=1 Tax=Phanerochaete carnosa (strain HHB-10118-sp) TaxID=650164 RepID=K5WRB2_PHACS|nr:uncharacterized protein PHACADRAFT_261598 [Phanerochaete carnosa HHB-10118-sp]EKM52907.1 hypothetical protein PHACADRAFT_261598 [Phanerochaete carnosa HHB-10118-sp]
MPGNLLSSHFRTMFEDTLTSSQQQQAIDSLQDYIHEIQYGTDDQRRDLGIIDDEDEDPEVIGRKLGICLEKCYWQLVMFFKSSKPSLISSAEPYLRYLLDSSSVKSDSTHVLEVTALLHLAAALAASAPTLQSQTTSLAPLGLLTPSTSSTSSFHHEYAPHSLPTANYASSSTRDDEALALFTRAFALYDAVTRSRGNSPSPTGTPAAEPSGSALGLYVSPRPTPFIAPASPMFAYGAPLSPCAALDSPRASRLSGICGRKGRLPAKTELWARASFVRLLQRLAFCEDEVQAEVHLHEAERQLYRMRSYVHENPYALPHDKYETFLAELARDFGIALPLSGTTAENSLDDQPSISRSVTPLRFSDAIKPVLRDSYPSLPPSSSSSSSSGSCSSASSSSSASPQTPYAPLSPMNAFAHALREREETKRPVLIVTAALRKLDVAGEVEHHEHAEAAVRQ